jgi:exodeoxyribonuclease VII small subunit
MSTAGPESTGSPAASGGGGAGLRPAGAAAGQGREQTFEEAQKELEQIVRRLEVGEASLDEAIALWQRGEELYRVCIAKLDAAQGEIEELAARRDQLRPVDRSFQTERGQSPHS